MLRSFLSSQFSHSCTPAELDFDADLRDRSLGHEWAPVGDGDPEMDPVLAAAAEPRAAAARRRIPLKTLRAGHLHLQLLAAVEGASP